MSSSNDLRLAVRSLAKSPVFTLTAALTLALGMGVSTAIFSLVNAILFRTLPVSQPDALVNVHATVDGQSFESFSYPNYRDLASGSGGALSGLAAFTGRFASVRQDGPPRVFATQVVSGNYFSVVGVTPRLGRPFGQADDSTPTNAVIVSDRFFRNELGGDAKALGRTLVVNGRPHTVVGVLPATFTGTFVGFRFDLWIPILSASPFEPGDARNARDNAWLELIGRLSPGVSRETAQAALATRVASLVRAYPTANKGMGVDVRKATPVDDSLRKVVLRLFGLLTAVSSLVLLIACVNVAGLLLVRGSGRLKELAIRQAIGASRAEIARQLLVETLVLFVFGGAGGFALALGLSKVLVGFAPRFAIPLEFDLSPDLRVLGVAAATSLLTGLVFGLAPALRSSAVPLVPALRDGASEGRSRLRGAQGLFVVCQVAASMLLLISAGLLSKAVEKIRQADPGFDAANVEMASLNLTLLTRDDARGRVLFRDLLSRSRELPGVESAALVQSVPLGGFGAGTVPVNVDGVTPPTPEGFPVETNTVSRGYFETLRIPLVSGRDFRDADDERAPAVAIVNETLATRFWPGGNALGQRVRVGGKPVEIVGVVKAGKYRSLMEEPRPLLVLPLSQSFRPRMTALLRTRPGASAAASFRAEVRSLDPDLPVLDTMRLSEYIEVSFLPQRMAGTVTAALGGLGLLLASIGLYGVIAYAVGQRTREIGIRVALGARSAHVLGLVLRQGALLVGAGIAAGGLVSLAATQVLSSLLFGVSPRDPGAFLVAGALLSLVSLLAAAVPARRALRVDPLVALRTE